MSGSKRPLQKCPGQQCGARGRCIPLSKLCDTQIDCLNAEDETFCQENYVGKPNFNTYLPKNNFADNISRSDQHFQDDFKEQKIDKTGKDVFTPDYEFDIFSKADDVTTPSNKELTYNDIENQSNGRNKSQTINEANPALDNLENDKSFTTTENSTFIMYSKTNTSKTGDTRTNGNPLKLNKTISDEISPSNSSKTKDPDDYVHKNISTVISQDMNNESSSHFDYTTDSIYNIDNNVDDDFPSTPYSFDQYTTTSPTDHEIKIINEYFPKDDHPAVVNSEDQDYSSRIPSYLKDLLYKSENGMKELPNYEVTESTTLSTDFISGSTDSVEDYYTTVSSSAPLNENKLNDTEIEKYEQVCKLLTDRKKVQNESMFMKNDNVQGNNTNLALSNATLINKPVNNTKTLQILNGTKKYPLFHCKRFKQSFLKIRRCDGILDCEDGTDERNCSCREKLVHIDSKRICDGDIDCYDGSDEKHCVNKCNKTDFYCPKSNKCIAYSLRCNGRSNCFAGDDEENCYALIKGDQLELDKSRQPAFSDEGVLAVRTSVGWRLLCTSPSDSQGVAFKACISLGFRGYEHFHGGLMKNESIFFKHQNTSIMNSTDDCYGLRLKCVSWNQGTPWMGTVIVEGEPVASAAFINTSWLLTHSSACKSLNLETYYVELSLGHDPISSFGIKTYYEQSRRIDHISHVKGLSACLIHVNSPFKVNKRIRILDILYREPDISSSFYAMFPTKYGPRQVNVTGVRNHCSSDTFCFTVPQLPVECSSSEESIDGGFVIEENSYSSSLVAIFSSFTVLCDPLEVISLKKLSSYSTSISPTTELQLAEPQDEPPCEGIRCGKCVGWANVSDGISDCYDQLDETQNSYQRKMLACQKSPHLCGCRIDQIKCEDGVCIDKSRFCDGHFHCEDGSDEPEGCKDSCVKFLQLTAPQKICDGVINCFDKSDENWDLCHKVTCNIKNAYKCRRSDMCIPQEFLCDSENDCPEDDDEENCVALQSSSNESEGILMEQHYGTWIPTCFKSFPTDFNKICNKLGFDKSIHQNLISSNRTVVSRDSFSPVKLNSHTTIIIRQGRPLTEFYEHSQCKYVFISCL